MRIVRALLVLTSLAACAWFAVGIRQAHDVDRVTTVVSGLQGQKRLTVAQADRADSLLDSAAVLNPDRTVQVLRARVALLSGHRSLAKQILLLVVAAEPDNIDAWYGLATSASDSATVNRALAQIARLDHARRR